MNNLDILNINKETKDVIVLMYNSFMRKQKEKFKFENVCKRYQYNIKDVWEYKEKITDYFFFFNYKSSIKLFGNKVYYQNCFYINLVRYNKCEYHLINVDKSNITLNIADFIGDLNVEIIVENPKMDLPKNCHWGNIKDYFIYHYDDSHQINFPNIMLKLYEKNSKKILNTKKLH